MEADWGMDLVRREERSMKKRMAAGRVAWERWSERFRVDLLRWAAAWRARLVQAKGQGTTEYAILVGVLVVIAILAITVFRPKLQELWDAIASGINGL